MEQSSSSNSIISSNFFDVSSSLSNVLHMIAPFWFSYGSLFFHLKSQLCSSSEVECEHKSKNPEVGTKQSTTTSSNEESDNDCSSLFGRDINMIMKSLGIMEHGLLEGEELEKKWGCNELCKIFDDEPSLEDVKEAFDVFDQNRDGFIDAGELQRVLIALGLNQGFELHDFRNMIRAFDQNNYGKLDFNEFVKFMPNTY